VVRLVALACADDVNIVCDWLESECLDVSRCSLVAMLSLYVSLVYYWLKRLLGVADGP